jgi:hypothetical protein
VRAVAIALTCALLGACAPAPDPPLDSTATGGADSLDMSDAAGLYAELRPELEAIADPLLEFGVEQVRKRGAFLPFGATLSASGEVSQQAALGDSDPATTADLLPVLIAGLRDAARSDSVVAVAAAEWVKIGQNGGELEDAVKVHVHHRRGLAVAFYIVSTRRLMRGWAFGEVMAKRAGPIVEAWATR